MSNLPLYQIVDYDRIFENFRSRVVDRCAFACVPNKHGGTGWSNIVSEPWGWSLYGLWVAIVQILSRQKKPRNGWLTADGTRDGRRLGSVELGHMLRAPASEIRRMLRVVSSPRVQWLALIEGVPERYADDERPMLERYGDDEPTMHGDDGEKIAGEIAERCTETIPKEGRKEGNSLKEDAVESNDPVTFAEAKRIISRISEKCFDTPLRDNQWQAKWDWHLDQALPMPRADFELLEWFYLLPDNHEIFRVTRRRQSVGSLIENLRDEPQKIRGALKAIGRNGAKPVRPSVEDEALPQAWGAAIKKLYGPEAFVPVLKKQLTPSVRLEVEAVLQATGK